MHTPMDISAAGLDLIKRWEGDPRTRSFSVRVYNDLAGLPTVGYGHKLTAAEIASGAFANGVGEATATRLLRADAATAVQAVNRLVTVALTQARFDALASFVYNVGAGNFQGSTALRMVNAQDWAAVPSAGLAARRSAEASLFQAA
ncbi:MAG: hypothetical protein JWM10_1660 [Myxococcaceae bacterium]|nr:hypothetical protein [Myxococcaceae bacterium]